MINWTDITEFDLTDLDPRKFDLPKFEMPDFDLPKVNLPNVDLPKVPDVDVPAELERVAGLARDAAYAGVGVVVIAAQAVDQRRRELTDQVTTQVRKLVDV